jgi:uncharacterized protein (DUF2147 family)
MLVSALALAAEADKAPGDAIAGLWLTEAKDARIEIAPRKVETDESEENAEDAQPLYDGKIVWLKDKVYGEDDPEAGEIIRDRNNPDEALRDRPIVGLKMLKGFKFAGESKWENGTIYDPEKGKTYKCVITLVKPEAEEDDEEETGPAPAKLHVRGYLGIPAFGRTTVWTRYTPPKEDEKSEANDAQ